MGYCTARSKEGEWKDVYDDPVRPRRNGYEWPPDFLQVGAWLVIWSLGILHYMIQIPYMNGTLFIVVVVITSVLLGGVVMTKVVLEVYSQEDPEVFRTDILRLAQEDLTEEAAPPGTEPCVFCRRYVQAGCKHCSVCDKCVPGFDHHCRWLNSCVGSKNYKLFATFMGLAWVGMVWIVAWSLYTIIQALRDIPAFKQKMQDQAYHSNPNAFPAIMVFNFLCLALAIAGACALGKLITFHLYLKYTNQSTYEHIMKKRQKKKERGEYKSSQAAAGNTKPAFCACLDLKKRRNFKKHGAQGTNQQVEGGGNAGSSTRASERHEPDAAEDADAAMTDSKEYTNRSRSDGCALPAAAQPTMATATAAEYSPARAEEAEVVFRQEEREAHEPYAPSGTQDHASKASQFRHHRGEDDDESPFSRREPPVNDSDDV